VQVDCLSGLGALYRGQGSTEAAIGYLTKALELADQLLGQPEVRASVLCNLGAARIPLDAVKAAEELQEAVEIREAQVRW